MSKHKQGGRQDKFAPFKDDQEKGDLRRIWLKDYAPIRRVDEFKVGKVGVKAERVRG